MADRLTDEQIEKIMDELGAENKIGAIKLYREFTGVGLKESKGFIDDHISGLIERDPEKYGHLASAGGKGCASIAAVFLIGLSIGIFFSII